jgi:hypothetical protein
LRPLRIGCVKYLNARPLIRGWQGEVEFDHPSALCKRLANGELDVALVSSSISAKPIYRIIDDVSISSDGPVYSVVVVHRMKFPNRRDRTRSRVEDCGQSPALPARRAWIESTLEQRSKGSLFWSQRASRLLW